MNSNPNLKLPLREDPKLVNVIEQCSDIFKRFARCSRRAMKSAKDSSAYKELMIQAAKAERVPELIDLPKSPEARKLKRRADNVLIMAMVRECGYVRSPLKDCVCQFACQEQKQSRDQNLASKSDLVSTFRSAPSNSPTPIAVTTDQQAALQEMAELDKSIDNCIRRYQFAMNICYVMDLDSFDLERLKQVKIQVVKPGEL